jgi:hypothetical protein
MDWVKINCDCDGAVTNYFGMIQRIGGRKVIIESDALTAINMIQVGVPLSSNYYQIVLQIIDVVLSLWLLYFTNKKIHNVIFKHK